MLRYLSAASVALLLCVPAIAATDSPGTGILQGSPRAAHRLTIVSAFSCPFCRILESQSTAELQQKWIPKGVQLEIVPAKIGQTDYASTVAAACGPVSGYLKRSTVLFRAQSSIQANWNAAPEAARNAAMTKPNGTGLEPVARLAGLYDLAPALGISQQQLRQCLTDPQRQQQPAKWDRLAATKWKTVATPSVFLDGKKVGSTWADAQAALVHAVAK